jgi:hypothetical protein
MKNIVLFTTRKDSCGSGAAGGLGVICRISIHLISYSLISNTHL